MSVNLEELAMLEKMIAEKRKKDADELKSSNLAANHLKLVSKTKLIDSEYQSKPSGWMLQSLITETQKPMAAKTTAIVALLVNIVKVDLVKVCEALGWIGGQG
jgi:hypothetical protein